MAGRGRRAPESAVPPNEVAGVIGAVAVGIFRARAAP
jgi:hypothetical protein